MSEYMVFCVGNGRNESTGAGYQKNNMAFNKQVTTERFREISNKCKTILKDLKLELNKSNWTSEWENKVSKEQWIELSKIPEFDIDIVEKIVGFKPDITSNTVDITVEGKTVTISRESAKALNLIN